MNIFRNGALCADWKLKTSVPSVSGGNLSPHTDVPLQLCSVDFSQRRCIFEKRAKCIRVRSGLGKQHSRSRGKIYPELGRPIVRFGTVGRGLPVFPPSAMRNPTTARNTIMGEIFCAWPSLEMQSGMTIAAAAAGSALRYLPAYSRCRNIACPFRENMI